MTNENLEYIAKSGLKALRDALVVGGITYLICEAGDNTIDESVLKAKIAGGFLGIVDYGARLLEKYVQV